MTPVQNIALVFIIFAVVKILVIAIKPKNWGKVVKGVYKNPGLFLVVDIVLAAIVLYYLLMEITIIQILAAIALGALLTAMSFAVATKEVVPLVNKMLTKDILKRAWLPLIVWIILIIWGLVALF